MARKAKNTRMCAGCMQRTDKKFLLKVTLQKDGIINIVSENEPFGRSIYFCHDLKCVEKAIKKKALNRSFKRDIPSCVYEDIYKHIDALNQE